MRGFREYRPACGDAACHREQYASEGHDVKLLDAVLDAMGSAGDVTDPTAVAGAER